MPATNQERQCKWVYAQGQSGKGACFGCVFLQEVLNSGPQHPLLWTPPTPLRVVPPFWIPFFYFNYLTVSWPEGPCRLGLWPFVCDTDICDKTAFWTVERSPGPLTFLPDTWNGCPAWTPASSGLSQQILKPWHCGGCLNQGCAKYCCWGQGRSISGVLKMEKMWVFKVLHSYQFVYCQTQCH